MEDGESPRQNVEVLSHLITHLIKSRLYVRLLAQGCAMNEYEIGTFKESERDHRDCRVYGVRVTCL